MAERNDIQLLAEAIQSTRVHAVSFKAPSFWTTNAAAWFTRVEAGFALNQPPITNDLTRFQHVLQLLDSETSRRVHAVIANPPQSNKYNALKSALLSAFEPTQFQKDSTLLHLNGLGDRRPSELLQYMRSLNTDPSTLFRCVFLHQLPPDVRRILAQTPDATLDVLAATADRIMDTEMHSTVAAVEPPISDSNAEINGVRASNSDRSHKSKFVLCKYHANFGAKARRCEKNVCDRPCAMHDLHDNSLKISSAGSSRFRSLTISVCDLNTGRSFLVDTGAEESVFPATRLDKQRRQGPNLVAANGTNIATYGKKSFPLKLDKNNTFMQDFWLANVTQPILGADFFTKHKLAIDLANQKLVAINGKYVIHAQATRSTCPRLHRIHSQYEAVLEEFPELLIPSFATNKHGVEHHIVTNGQPVYARPRRLDPEKLAAAKAEFEEMERLGIVRRSSSSWSSPLHMVKKSNGTWRPCGDFRRLNDITVDDKYPLPHIQDLNANLQGKTIFSKLDLVRGYHQIPVAKHDVPKTAVVTPFGLYEFVCMPFGLKNAAQAFQRLMDGVLQDLDCCFVYLDDILVASASAEQHIKDLRSVCHLLSANGLVINQKKCVFGKPEIQFLGHVVSSAGIIPLPEKVRAVADFPRPKEKKELQRFLGMLNFYHRFIPNVARLSKSLTDAIRGKDKSIVWSSECIMAFNKSKSALASAVMLHHPDPSAPTKLTVDASDTAIGAELSQYQRKSWIPIAFFSRKLSPTQCRYSTFDRELLAVFSAVKHFRYFLEGRQFSIYTDHKPLTYAFRSSTDRSPRQERQLSFISEFSTDIHHISGMENVVPDTLSRAPVEHTEPLIASSAITTSLDFTKLAEAQLTDQDVKHLQAHPGSLKLENVKLNNVDVLCDVSMDHPRPVVPMSWRRSIFSMMHNLSHAGPKPTIRAISSRYVWKGMKKEVREWVKSCHACQSSKISRHTKSPLVEFPKPSRRFGDIHVDLVGPLPPSEGKSYLLTVVDRFTRWPEAIPITNAHAITCARALLRTWISRFGVPNSIVSDQGPQFTSHLWKELHQVLGIQQNHTTAYHPQANGMVERFHRTLKAALKARLTGPKWMDELPLVLLGIRSTWKEDTQASPAMMTYCANLRVPGDFIYGSVPKALPNDAFVRELQRHMQQLSPQPVEHHGQQRVFVPLSLRQATHVYMRHDAVRGPLVRPYDGPFKVLERDNKHFLIEREGKPYRASVDRLKPAFIIQ